MALFPLSSTTWTFGSLLLDDAITKVAEIGFDGVDIPVFRQMPVDETGSAERRRIRRVVERAGLVQRRQDGRLSRCALDATPMKNAADWVERYRRYWEQQLDALARYLEHEENTNGNADHD